MTTSPRRRPTGAPRPAPHQARLCLEPLEAREVPAALVGLTTANQLISIPSDNPTFSSGFPNPAISPPSTPTPITGLAAGERVVGIDFRPRTGQLYALAVDADGTGTNARLLTLTVFTVTGQPTTVTANQVGTFTVPVASPDARYGFDFDPATDLIRVINSADANFFLNPDNGGTAGGTSINPPGRSLDSAAHAPNFRGMIGSLFTTLYTIDAGAATLRRIGFPSGLNPNNGELSDVGPLGVPIDPNVPVGFDVGPLPGEVFAVFDGDPAAGLAVGLYSINLASGAATPLGLVGNGTIELSGLAVVPESSVAVGVVTPGLPADSFARLLVVGVGPLGPSARPGFPERIVPFVGYRGSLATAVADVNRDAVPDLVVAAATAGNNGHVKVFSGVDGSLLMSFFAFEGFAGGVLLAAGDVGGEPGGPGGLARPTGAADGFADVVVVAAGGGNGHVKAFSGRNGLLLGSFFSFPGFLGPVSVAVSDLDLDRGFFRDEIVVAAGSNGHVKAFNVDGSPFGGVSFFAFEGFFGPVNLAGGDVTGDGLGDIVAGSGASAGHLKVFSGRPGNPLVLSFVPAFPGQFGVSVGTTDASQDGRLDVAVGQLAGGLTDVPLVRFFDGLTGADVGAPIASFVRLGTANSGSFVSGGRA
jgi:hypothetical protein